MSNKLTPEKARELIQQWKRNQSENSISITAEYCLQAMELALVKMTEPRMMTLGVMSESKFQNLDNGNVRFIALWPRPGVAVYRKRPDDGVLVYARIGNAGEGEQP
ncbi:hypothetical protein [Kosakonia radicincitans]|uniref:hypothetical protein n=1 Tax=Kosakonia radicincitans TaxID=283686 RepID=UPI001D060DC2|nr:hypothetical protein [Kosakonia radicincitans]